MSDTRLKAAVAVTGAGLVLVIGLGAVIGSRTAADDLRSRSEQALAAAGLDGVAVDFDGREAVLHGGSRADLHEALAIVRRIDGVRRAAGVSDDDTGSEGGAAIVDPATRPSLDLRRTPEGATISGVVPDADAQARIRAAAAAAFGTIKGDLVVDPAVGEAGWVAQIPDAFDGLRDVTGLDIRIGGGGTLELSGSVGTAAARDEAVRLLAAAVTDLEVDDALDVTRKGS